MERKTFQVIFFTALIVVMPIIYHGLIPAGVFTILALRTILDAAGADQSVPWVFALIGASGIGLAWIVAFGCGNWIEQRSARRKRVMQLSALLAVLLSGALPIYGAGWHGRPEFTNAYVAYSKLFGSAAL